jgi:hypothetical protein
VHETIEARIAGFVHFIHAPGTERSDDFVDVARLMCRSSPLSAESAAVELTARGDHT